MLIVATVAGLASQTQTLVRNLRTPPPIAGKATPPHRPGTTPMQRDALFGPAHAAPDSAPTLPVRLQASFVRADSRQSSAILAFADGRTRRLRMGEEALPGIRLTGIWPDRVTLGGQGRSATLGFPPAGGTAANAIQP